jgi:hypothetical protein
MRKTQSAEPLQCGKEDDLDQAEEVTGIATTPNGLAQNLMSGLISKMFYFISF